MRILIDMDVPIADYERQLLSRWRQARPDAPFVPLADRKAFYAHHDYSDEYRDAVAALRDEPGFFESMPPTDGAIEAIKAMADAGLSVWICTAPASRHPTCAQEKLAFTTRHLGIEWNDRVIIAKDKTLVRGDILIDDKPSVTGVMTPVWEHVIFDSPPNRHVTGKRRINWSTWRSLLLGHPRYGHPRYDR